MPVMMMDTSENEVKEKTPKTKKAKGSNLGAGNHKILDFFKPPVKESVSRQKSLLQFFSKSAASKLPETKSEEFIDISVVDKENVEADPKTFISCDDADTVVTVEDLPGCEKEDAESSNKSDDEDRESSNKSDDEDRESSNKSDDEDRESSNKSDDEDRESSNKSDGKKSGKCQGEDSIIILSDTSCDASAIINVETCKDDESKSQLDASNGEKTDTCEVIKTDVQETAKSTSKPTEIESNGVEEVSVNITSNNSTSCNDGQNEKAGNSMTNLHKDDDASPACDKVTDNFKVPGMIKKAASGLKSIPNDISCINNECLNKNSLGPDEVQMKNALSGREMLSLLKEVQEPDDKKEKKKKKKHKHKKREMEKERQNSSDDGSVKKKKKNQCDEISNGQTCNVASDAISVELKSSVDVDIREENSCLSQTESRVHVSHKEKNVSKSEADVKDGPKKTSKKSCKMKEIKQNKTDEKEKGKNEADGRNSSTKLCKKTKSGEQKEIQQNKSDKNEVSKTKANISITSTKSYKKSKSGERKETQQNKTEIDNKERKDELSGDSSINREQSFEMSYADLSGDSSINREPKSFEMSYADFLKKMEMTVSEENSQSNEEDGKDVENDSKDDIVEIEDKEMENKHSFDTEDSSEERSEEKCSLTSSTQSSQSGIARFFTSSGKKVKSQKAQDPSVSDSESKRNVNKAKKSGVGRKLKLKKSVSTENAEQVDESESQPDDAVVAAAKADREKQKQKFLSESSKAVSVTNTKQATLSFGASGLTMAKPAAALSKSLSTDSVCSLKGKSKKTKVSKAKHPENDAIDVVNLDDTTNEANPLSHDETDCMEDDCEDSGGRRRSTRKKYQVSGFQLDMDKKTPIKIKLKRCAKTESSREDAESMEKSSKKELKIAKQSKALALLEKAKKTKQKKKAKHKDRTEKQNPDLDQNGKEKRKKMKKKGRKFSDRSTDSECGSTRRSSRLEGRSMASMEEVSLENIVISSDEDEPVRKKRRPKSVAEEPKLKDKKETPNKGTPRKGTPKKQTGDKETARSPSKKAGVPLAPMFLMGKKAVKTSPKKPALDPELVRQRQEFLMSGVPDELKKQTATRIAATPVADFPPLPKINHVQQRPNADSSDVCSRVDTWNLGPVQLKLRDQSEVSTIRPVSKFTGGLMCTRPAQVDVQNIKGFTGHKVLEDSLLLDCQREISSYNTSYSVQRMYKALKRAGQQPAGVDQEAGATDSGKDAVTEVVVIDEEEEATKPRRRGRSLKLAKKPAQPEPIETESVVDNKTSYTGPSLLWTDKYQPVHSNQVLGNSGVLKKLRSWLTEWKHVLDREARKARKLLLKKNKGKQLQTNKDDNDMWDDDSDFDLSSDDSEDDDLLCNTMLLSGPHGCGKTSSVYALALEVGFKVHEVNASSSRSGRQILSQLQEATQSHQVSSKSVHSPTKLAAKNANKAQKQDVKMSAAFTNLFKKSSTPTAPDDGDKGKKRKRAKQEKDGCEGKRQKKEGLKGGGKGPGVMEGKSGDVVGTNINLSSTTLILFDEADVVFDEDKGFLNAVQTFMSTTKIPIILTTADPGFNSQFDGRYELLTLKRPTATSVASHLQTISLAENLRIDHERLSELVHQCRGDVRKSLMSVQYQLESGGGHTVSYRTVAKPPTTGLEENTGSGEIVEDSQSSQVDTGTSCTGVSDRAKEDDDDDDFVILKPLKKRRRMLDDDNSNSVDKFADTFKPKSVVLDAVADDEAARAFPPVHYLCMETMLGIDAAQNNVAAAITHALKAKSIAGLSELIALCDSIKQLLNTSLIYNNLPLVLPLTTVLVNSIAKPDTDTNTGKKEDKKRKRIQCDLYDSEASNDGIQSAAEHSDPGIDSDSVDNNTKSSNCNKSDCPEEGKCMYESLSAFSRFCDSMCVMDTLESAQSLRHENVLRSGIKGRLVAGVADELPAFHVPCGIDTECCRTYSSEVEGRGATRLYQEIDEIQGRVETLCENNPALSQHFQLPVLRGAERMSLIDRHTASVPADLQRVQDGAVDSLPLVVHKHPRNLHLDYIPTLRNICRQENCRQLTNAKRRFHHYFDNIALPMKEKTMGVLATSCL